ncbi:YHS domain-containing (seleno)protein [Roseivirga pacifica]
MKLTISLLSLLLGLTAFGQIPTKHYNLKRGIAIQGYDPVSYFEKGEAEKGLESIQYKYNGATYLFASSAHKQAFEANPAQYEPTYGGYCAYAMADGNKVKIDPKTFKLLDGKLYLFYNFRGTNTLTLWNDEEASLLPKADKAWKKIINQ